MRVRVPNGKLNNRNHQLLQVIDRLRLASGMSESEMRGVLGLKPEDFSSMIARGKQVPLKVLSALADHFELNIESIMDGKIDYHAVEARQKGQFYLPERYQVAAFSTRRTAVYILDYLEKFIGWRAQSQLLRHFQLRSSFFYGNLDQGGINQNLMKDFCSYLVSRGYQRKLFVEMGSYSIITNQLTELGRAYSSLRDPLEVYEYSFSEFLHYYERNCDYQVVSLDRDGCVIEGKSKADVAAALGVKELGSSEICAIRCGIFSALLGYIGLPFASVKEVACVHHGDGACRFQIDYRAAVAAQRSREQRPDAAKILFH